MKWGDNETKIWRNFVENANESSEIRHFRLLQIGLPIYCNFILLTFNIIKIGLIKKEIMYTCICTLYSSLLNKSKSHFVYSHPAQRCPVFCENCFNLGILYFWVASFLELQNYTIPAKWASNNTFLLYFYIYSNRVLNSICCTLK